jgi:predicted Zn-dependent protease
MGSANAWTAMPGQTPSGAVLESRVADNANIIAHEVGHYLSLDHTSDQSNLMNPIIYDNSTTITEQQCQDMRHTAVTVRAGAIR